MVLVNHQQRWAITLNQPVLLGLERSYEDRRSQIFGEIARGNSAIPAASPLFRQLIVCQRAGRYRVNCLPAIFALVGPQLEDERFAGAGGSLNDDVFACAQGGHSFLLP